MKIRTGFVSNSSSSSFVVQKKYLTAKQIECIKQHVAMGREWNKEGHGCMIDDYDAWKILETDETIEGATDMDNFDMIAWLRHIGVDMDKVKVSDTHAMLWEDCAWCK